MSALNDFLLSIPLLNNLGPFTITELAEQSKTLKFKKGSILLEQGSECNSLYFVASGKLEFYKNLNEKMVVFKTLNPGDVFGEVYFFSNLPVDGYLRAAANTVVVAIDRNTVDSVLKNNTTFFRNYINQLTKNHMADSESITSMLNILLAEELYIPEPFKLLNDFFEDPFPGEPALKNSVEPVEEDIFYQKDLLCPLCNQKYQTLKPRHKYTVIDRTDEDFCPYYKVVNPLYYEINTCPGCGYSFNNSTSTPVKTELKESVQKVLNGLYKGEDYTGVRNLEDAIQTFKLAIQCQKQMGAGNYAMSRLYLKLGWLYRYQKNAEKEKEQMEQALYHLLRFFDEADIEEPKEEMNIMYLIGQIYLNLNDKPAALNWFIRIAQHPNKNKYPYLVNRAREYWKEIRKNLK